MSQKELRKGFSPSYFSLEDILASNARVPCQTKTKILHFGFLDPSQGSEHLPEGSQVELPLWAARAMSKQSRNFVSCSMPKNYNEKFSDILRADATVIDLNRMGPQYYQTGLQLCTLPNDEAEYIADALPEAFQRRIMAMNDAYSLNRSTKSADEASYNDTGTMLRTSYMDPLETQLFEDSKKASQDLDRWMKGS